MLESRQLTNFGPTVAALESDLGTLLEIPPSRVVTVANATLGLELIARAMGLKGRVILPSFTFVSTAHSLANAGLEPVFADIDPESYCLAPAAVEALLTSDVTAVVPVHVYGHFCDVDYFESLSDRGISVLYDAAHSIGTRWGNCTPSAFGDAAIFSFHATKIINACEGGAVTVRDEALAERLRRFTNFGIINEVEVAHGGTNAKMSEVHALFARHSLRHLKEAIDRRLLLANRYRERLQCVEAIRLPRAQVGLSPNAQFFPIRLSSEGRRDRVYDRLTEQGIFARKYFYPPLHQLPPYRHSARGPLTVTESLSREILCLPLHSSLTLGQVDFVVDKILACLRVGTRKSLPQAISTFRHQAPEHPGTS